MRKMMNRKTDRAVFHRTAKKVAAANIPSYYSPRGGIRL